MKTLIAKSLFIALAFGAIACTESVESDDAKAAAELPSSFDGKADWRTKLFTDVRRNVDIGEVVNDHYDGTSRYVGYTANLSEGDIVDIRVGDAGSGFDSVIGVYGPQRPGGGWGGLLDSNDDDPAGGTYDSYLQLEVEREGNYLVIVRDYSYAAGDFFVQMDCAGGTCDGPKLCEREVFCALFCPNGFASDADGCATCSCSDEPLPIDLACAPAAPSNNICAQVIAYGKHPVSGECCQYPTPCNVPDGYQAFPSLETCEGVDVDTCQDGDTKDAEDGCNTCFCSGGNWACTEIACLPIGSCRSDADCVETGCSGQICAAEHMASTCDFRPEYACYNDPTTSCGCNAGVCGWAQTQALTSCLAGFNN